MILVADIGNTNISFALFHGDAIKGRWRARSDKLRTADEYAVWLVSLLQQSSIALAGIEALVIVSVVPALSGTIEQMGNRALGAKKSFLLGTKALPFPIEARIDIPSQAGADRLVNAFEAWACYGGPLVAIDFGTATSFDVVTKDGAFAGGLLAPGVNLSLEALYKAASRLPRIEIMPPQNIIGKNTEDAMRGGIYWGYLSMVEGIISRMSAALEDEPRVIATGGLADFFAKACPKIELVDPDLTLRGIKRVYDYYLEKGIL